MILHSFREVLQGFDVAGSVSDRNAFESVLDLLDFLVDAEQQEEEDDVEGGEHGAEYETVNVLNDQEREVAQVFAGVAGDVPLQRVRPYLERHDHPGHHRREHQGQGRVACVVECPRVSVQGVLEVLAENVVGPKRLHFGQDLGVLVLPDRHRDYGEQYLERDYLQCVR